MKVVITFIHSDINIYYLDGRKPLQRDSLSQGLNIRKGFLSKHSKRWAPEAKWEDDKIAAGNS